MNPIVQTRSFNPCEGLDFFSAFVQEKPSRIFLLLSCILKWEKYFGKEGLGPSIHSIKIVRLGLLSTKIFHRIHLLCKIDLDHYPSLLETHEIGIQFLHVCYTLSHGITYLKAIAILSVPQSFFTLRTGIGLYLYSTKLFQTIYKLTNQFLIQKKPLCSSYGDLCDSARLFCQVAIRIAILANIFFINSSGGFPLVLMLSTLSFTATFFKAICIHEKSKCLN